jgi:hypothetical protein
MNSERTPRTLRSLRKTGKVSATVLLLLAASCAVTGDQKTDTARLAVTVTLPDGSPVPDADNPGCVDLRGAAKDCPADQRYLISVEAKNVDGERDTTFNGFARVTITPGTLTTVTGDAAAGRNVKLDGGFAENIEIGVTGAYGETRVQVEDLGYVPIDPANGVPGCSDGLDNDNDGLIDFPADPGCAFANDDTEQGGSFASGVSPAIHYRLPTVAEANGNGSATPYPEEGLEIDTHSEGVNVIVTRVSTDGFYVADMAVARDDSGEVVSATQKPWGSLFVFNFGVPPGMRVCDRLTLLTGTMTEFFGYTEMSFPGFRVKPWDFRPIADGGDGKCLVPEPFELVGIKASNDAVLEPYEGGLVRVNNGHVSAFLGAAYPNVTSFAGGADDCPTGYSFEFGPGASNCDFNRDGKLDFTKCGKEAGCADSCYGEPECSEFSAFRSRGNFRIVLPGAAGDPRATILANTGTVTGFAPMEQAGRVIPSITGTASNFSGGDLRWTIETRCDDDLVYCPIGDDECLANPPAPKLSESACVKRRTQADNEAGAE